jgi:hypothetical protein
VSFPDFFSFSGFAVQGDTGDIKLTPRTEDRRLEATGHTLGVSRTTRPVDQRLNRQFARFGTRSIEIVDSLWSATDMSM